MRNREHLQRVIALLDEAEKEALRMNLPQLFLLIVRIYDAKELATGELAKI